MKERRFENEGLPVRCITFKPIRNNQFAGSSSSLIDPAGIIGTAGDEYLD